MDVEVRAARPEDATAVAELLGELGYPATKHEAGARLRRLAEDDRSHVLLACASGAVVGLAALHVTPLLERDAPACLMTALVVAARSRRRGIGAALAAAIEQEARERGCDRVVVGSAERRADAHAFYARLGYAYTGRRFVKALGS